MLHNEYLGRLGLSSRDFDGSRGGFRQLLRVQGLGLDTLLPLLVLLSLRNTNNYNNVEWVTWSLGCCLLSVGPSYSGRVAAQQASCPTAQHEVVGERIIAGAFIMLGRHSPLPIGTEPRKGGAAD